MYKREEYLANLEQDWTSTLAFISVYLFIRSVGRTIWGCQSCLGLCPALSLSILILQITFDLSCATQGQWLPYKYGLGYGLWGRADPAYPRELSLHPLGMCHFMNDYSFVTHLHVSFDHRHYKHERLICLRILRGKREFPQYTLYEIISFLHR